MAPRYKVTLTKEERKELEAISTKGRRAARTVLSARALLLLDAGEYGPKWVVARVAEAVGRTTRSLEHIKNSAASYRVLQQLQLPELRFMLVLLGQLVLHVLSNRLFIGISNRFHKITLRP